MDPALQEMFLEVAQRARTLDELLSIGSDLLSKGVPPPDEPRPDAAEIMGSWHDSYARGDRAAFERRLGWDGLTYETAMGRISLALSTEHAALPEWIDPLVQVLGGGASRESVFATIDDLPSLGDIPFAPAWVPFVRLAADRLWEVAEIDEGRIGEHARLGLERQLLRQIARASEEALHGLFVDFRTSLRETKGSARGGIDSPSSRKILGTFVDWLYSGGFVSFFLRYPVVARQVCTLIHTWVSAEQEFLRRLREDLRDIERTFHGGGEVGPLVEIAGSLSDRHHGGRRVHGLRFASGLRLIYKPRDVGTEVAFQELLTGLRDAGLDCAPAAIRILDRKGYGWTEFVPHAAASDEDRVRAYYRKAGAHLCLGYLLNGIDLHMDNVIAGPDGPVLIDLELILQPGFQPSGAAMGDGSAEGGDALHGNSLQSGYLTSLRSDPLGRIYDMGGLYGLGGHLAGTQQRIWKETNTDSMRYEIADIQAAPEPNVLCWNGRPIMAETFAMQIVDGFSTTYRWIQERAETLLSEGGPIASFAGRRTRLLLRDSNHYGSILRAILTPPFQKAGHFPGILMDSMNRGFRYASSAPWMWSATHRERSAMERLDVPYFATTTDGTDVLSDDEIVLPGAVARTGMQTTIDRIRALDENDLETQVRRLRAALPDVPWGRTSSLSVPEDPQRSEAQRAAPLIRAAWGVAEIVRAEIETSSNGGRLAPDASSAETVDPLLPFYLYDGEMGIALFLAALAGVLGSSDDGARALSIARRVDETLRLLDGAPGPLPVGACNGLGGVTYALTCIADLIDDSSLLETARRAALLIRPDLAGTRGHFDVEGGLAGAILGILALHDAAPQDSLLDRARLCGDTLAGNARAGPHGGWGWPDADGTMRAGFAHGAAGIAYAFGRLYGATNDPTYRSAAMETIAFERSLYDREVGNWPVIGPAGSPGPGSPLVMNAWCHGAPGIALSRVGLVELLEDESVRNEAESALVITLRAELSDKDHLCCGNMGRVGVLHWSGQVLGNLDLQRAASARVLVVLERALTKGRFTVPSDDTTGSRQSLGFFRGLSGIGYEALRLIRARELPSVLAFRPPARGH